MHLDVAVVAGRPEFDTATRHAGRAAVYSVVQDAWEGSRHRVSSRLGEN